MSSLLLGESALMEAVRNELQRMEEIGVITPVTEPTANWTTSNTR